MPLAGTPMQPRDAARLLFDEGWVQADNLLKMLVTVMAESDLFSHAWHYNDPKDGGDGSTDWGVFQLNDGNKGGDSPIVGPTGLPMPVAGGLKPLHVVQEFAVMACDPHKAVKLARDLYVRRGLQPWAAYRPASESWNKRGPKASYGIRAMLHVLHGWPSP